MSASSYSVLARRSLVGAVALAPLVAACGSDGGETSITATTTETTSSATSSVPGLPVGSPCSASAECAGPGTPECLTDGLFPLGELASSDNPTAQALAEIGVPLPDGYCSTVPPCESDADCGLGGACFFPLEGVDPDYFASLVDALGLSAEDAAVVLGFLDYGRCLRPCESPDDCGREGYECATPIEDFLALVEGADMSTFCIGEPPASCEPSPCVHGSCTVEDGGPVCSCDAGWAGELCDENVDECSPNPCQHGGTCTDGVDSFECDCATAPGWQGTLCGDDEPDCTPNPCAHGSCTEGEAGTGTFSCECDAGWDATLCDHNIDDCDPEPCLNGGICQDGVASFTCSCPGGFTGTLCETPVLSCADSPCVHGSCEDTGPNQYECTCDAGWDGTNCDFNIDDCTPNECLNGGTCIDGIDSFSCDCATAPGWQGTHCETALTTHCVLTYDLAIGNGSDSTDWTGCNMRIRDTFLGLGDDTNAVGPGLLVLRVPSDGGQNVAAGTIEVLYYELTQEFTQNVTGATIVTDVDAACPALGQSGNSTEQALGTLALGASPTVTWSSCSYPAGYNNSNTSFTPDVVGTGDGCLAPYRSTGNVNCTGWACGNGGLSQGDNPQDETWEQAMNQLVFSADMQTFRMGFMLVPNRSPSRTYLSWEGSLGSKVCQ